MRKGDYVLIISGRAIGMIGKFFEDNGQSVRIRLGYGPSQSFFNYKHAAFRPLKPYEDLRSGCRLIYRNHPKKPLEAVLCSAFCTADNILMGAFDQFHAPVPLEGWVIAARVADQRSDDVLREESLQRMGVLRKELLQIKAKMEKLLAWAARVDAALKKEEEENLLPYLDGMGPD